MQDSVQIKENLRDTIAKYTIKDSVFTDLFQDKKYLIQLYRTLHPEDKETSEDGLSYITIKNVLTDSLYNDLGFMVGDSLMVLVEAQSTWTVNIAVRVLLYLAQSYHNYFEETKQNLYKEKKARLPKPELYVIYNGKKGNKPDVISLAKEFFGGEDSVLDIKVKVIYESDDDNDDNIINQYIVFSKVYDEQRKLHGRTKTAIVETIRICKDRNILKEYLESREKEVVSIMLSLYNEEEIMMSYINSERYEAAQEATLAAARETAKRLLKKGKMTLEEIAECVPELSLDELKKLEDELMQTV